jgi:hypothetical protein
MSEITNDENDEKTLEFYWDAYLTDKAKLEKLENNIKKHIEAYNLPQKEYDAIMQSVKKSLYSD